jgi:hypothetical protein
MPQLQHAAEVLHFVPLHSMVQVIHGHGLLVKMFSLWGTHICLCCMVQSDHMESRGWLGLERDFTNLLLGHTGCRNFALCMLLHRLLPLDGNIVIAVGAEAALRCWQR